MKFESTSIPGLTLIVPDIKGDARGRFIKTFHLPSFRERGLSVDFKESFYTTSSQGVLRGFHFQTPPHEHDKLVTCVKGEILDAVVDIRKNSPTYGQALSFSLSESNAHELFIPKGLAHAFLTVSAEAVVVYSVTEPYSPRHDAGIHWASVPISWTEKNPLVSERDQAFVSLEKFNSPFEFVRP